MSNHGGIRNFPDEYIDDFAQRQQNLVHLADFLVCRLGPGPKMQNTGHFKQVPQVMLDTDMTRDRLDKRLLGNNRL